MVTRNISPVTCTMPRSTSLVCRFHEGLNGSPSMIMLSGRALPGRCMWMAHVPISRAVALYCPFGTLTRSVIGSTSPNPSNQNFDQCLVRAPFAEHGSSERGAQNDRVSV